LGDIKVPTDQATTKQSLTVAELLEERARMRSLIEAAGVGLWDWDIANSEIYFSPEWKRQLGYADHEIPNQFAQWEDRLHPADREPTLAAVREFREGRRADYDVEFRLRHKDGSWRWISARGDITRDGTGQSIRMMGCHLDITARKELAASLSFQRDLLERIASGSPLEESLKLLARALELHAGDILCSILLLSDDGLHLSHGAAPSLPEAYCRAIDGIAVDAAVGSCGTAAFRREPVIVEDIATDPLWVNFRTLALQYGLRACWSTPIVDGQRQVLGTFAIYQRQPGRPTQQHLQLIALAANIAAIAIGKHKTEARLRLSDVALKTISQGVVFSRPDGVIISANPAFTSITGYSEAEIKGRTCKLLQGPLTDPQTVEAIRQAQKKNQEFGGEILNYRKDGAVFWNELSISPVHDEQGHLTHYFGVMRDSTERRRAADALRLFRTLWDQSNDTFEVVDPDTGEFLDVNEKGPAELGCTRAEYLSLRVHDIDPLVTKERWQQLLEAIKATGSQSGESRHRRMDGTTFPVEFNAKWVRLDRDYIVTVVRDVSERKRAEAALRDNERRLREAQAIARMGNFHWDARTNRVTWSDELFRIYGYLPGAFEPQFDSYIASVHPDDRPRVLGTLQNAMVVGGRFDQDYRIVLADDSVRWVHSRGRTITGDDGSFAGMEGICQDISQRKQAETALQASERELRLITDLMPGLVSRVDRDLRYVFINQEYEKAFGKSREEILGHRMPEILSDKLFRRVEPNIRRVLAGESVSFETGIQTPAGETRHGIAHYVPELDVDHRVVGFIVVIVDVTEVKQAEAALRVSDVALKSISQGVLVTVPDGTIVSINDAFTAITGYRKDELVGQPCSLLSGRLSDPQMADRIRLARQQGVPFSAELLDCRKDGTPFWNDLTISPAHDQQGRLTHFIGVTRDITVRKQAEAARELLEARLRESQKMEAIGTLAGGIAHDFNNIIAIILGNAELARADLSVNSLALLGLEEINKAGLRARDLVQQILSFSRRQSTQRKLVAPASIVEESVRLLRATMPAYLNIEVHCERTVPAILADTTQLQQVLINLATNAMQAMRGRPGRIVIRLDTVTLDAAAAQTHPVLHTLHEKHPGPMVRLLVSDDGPGMDAATRARIFEPFFTTKAVGEGTGLGLAVVHGIVRGHEGAIVVDSEVGKGATFTIYLPAAGAAADGLVPGRPGVATHALPDCSGGQHILYVDDEKALVSVVKRALERNRIRVSAHTDPHLALAALEFDPAAFDLVVTDYSMPGMSGLELARKIRALRADLPVVVVSGFVDEELRAKAAGAGVREVLFKATELKDLCAVVQRLAPLAPPRSAAR
jgi:PAS domain S-box-containing protein